MAKGVYQVKEGVIAYNNGDGLKFHKVEYPGNIDPERVDLVNNYTTGNEYAAPNMKTGSVYEFDFRTYMLGVGTPGSGRVPHWHTLLLAAGFAESGTTEQNDAGTFIYTAGNTNHTDDVVAGATDPVDIVWNIDRRLWKTMTNCVFDGAFVLTAGQIPMIEFKGYGKVPSGYAVDTALATRGADFAITPFRAENVTVSFTQVAPSVTGTATANGTTTLTDSAADFLAEGVQVGWIVTNDTSSSTGGGVVSAVTATVLTITPLTGGTPANITSGDSYSVNPPASFTASDWNVRSVVLPFGNNIQHQPSIGGPNGYDDPRIIGRSGGVFYAIDMYEPNRAGAFDWQRAAEVANGNDAHYFTVTITVNSTGTAGNKFEFIFDGKPTGKGGDLSGSVGSELRRTLVFEQLDTETPLTLLIT